MFPVLLTIGNFAVSSFGVFLALGFLLGVFLIWRLSRAWDMDEEKVLDLTLLTFLGGLIGARVYFVIEHWDFFAVNFSKAILFYKFPGFSFWGGVLGGWLTLFYFSKRFKLDFWQIADIAAVGFLGGLILSDIGCLLGGCGAGIPYKGFLAVAQIGNIGLRFPTQAVQALLLTFALFKIWKRAIHFHLRGVIVAQTLIFIAVIKLLTEPLRANHNQNYFFLLTLFLLGWVIFYRVTGRNILVDIRNLGLFLVNLVKSNHTGRDARALLIEDLKKGWYNQTTSLGWKFRSLKKFLGRLNVRFSYKNTKQS